MKRYRFFRHTADAKFRAYGSSLEEAFANAALAVASLMWDWKRIALNTRIRVNVKGRDLQQLLVNFLEEVLYLMDTRGFLLGSVEDLTITRKGERFTLCAFFRGDTESGDYVIIGEVKAITYNEMMIREGTKSMVQVVVDV